MRPLMALAAGLLVGLIVIEAILAAIRLFTSNPELMQDLGSGMLLPGTHLLAVSATWLVGATLAGAMSTVMSGTRVWGWLAGLLLCLPALLTLTLAGYPWAMVSAGLVPLAGAIAGSALARRTLPN